MLGLAVELWLGQGAVMAALGPNIPVSKRINVAFGRLKYGF